MNGQMILTDIPKQVREILDSAVTEGHVDASFIYCLAFKEGFDFAQIMEHLRLYTNQEATKESVKFSRRVQKVIHDLYHE